VIGILERQARDPRWLWTHYERSNHEIGYIRLGGLNDSHRRFRPRAVQRRICWGWRSGNRHDGRVLPWRNDDREFDHRAEQRHVKRCGQRRGWTSEWAQSVWQHPHQPVAERLDPDAGADRQIKKKPRIAGLF
jgi:hypothetical protein